MWTFANLTSPRVNDDSLEDSGEFLNSFALTPEGLAEAIEIATENSGFLGGANTGSDWVLGVVIRRSAFVEGTEHSMAREAGVVLDWSLTPSGDTEPSWRERVSTRDRKTMSDFFAGDKRTAVGLETAVRKNSEKAFQSLEASGVLARVQQ